jgi:nickel/cobalt exporter
MPNIEAIIQSGSSNAWFLLPTALVLGALHALEPGHSKSMMTAFIVAIHGTVRQAALLAIAATVGHTIIIWILALVAWRLGDAGLLEQAEPWLMLIGGLLMVVLGYRILMRQGLNGVASQSSHDHHHSHAHPHDHGHGHDHHGHGHTHLHSSARDDEDAHARAHEAEIKRRFTSGPVTNAEIIWFGLGGGLMPCPAAFAVLLACLHQKAYFLGVVMVAVFSIGLAVMMISIGVAAAWGAGALKSRGGMFERISRWAPFVSACIVILIGGTVAAEGARNLGLINLRV